MYLGDVFEQPLFLDERVRIGRAVAIQPAL
jgi:hypothetical protein